MPDSESRNAYVGRNFSVNTFCCVIVIDGIPGAINERRLRRQSHQIDND
jgi:hypothetical protein